MAYQNYFPATCQPMYQPQPVQYQQPQPQGQGIIWIQGEAAAKSYLIAPGNSVVLFDSENPVFYIKSADQTGMPTMRKFRFEEVSETANVSQETPNYITREEFEQRIAELMAPKRTTARKETKDNG